MSNIIRPETPTACPITKAKTPAGRALLKAHAEWADAYEAMAKLEAEHADAWSAHDAATSALADAMASGDPTTIPDAEAALAETRAVVERPWQRAAATRARECYAKAAAYRKAIDDGFLDLLTESEVGPAAAEVKARILEAVADLQAAIADHSKVRVRHEALARHARGVDVREVHSLGALGGLRSALGAINADTVDPPTLYHGVAHRHKVLKETGSLPKPSVAL